MYCACCTHSPADHMLHTLACSLMPHIRAAGHAHTDILNELPDLNTQIDMQAAVAGAVRAMLLLQYNSNGAWAGLLLAGFGSFKYSIGGYRCSAWKAAADV